MSFNLETALSVANQLVFNVANRHLTDIESAVFTGAWNREDYDSIAAKAQYSTGYISQDVAPKLWKLLSESLDEKVRKNNFKEALKRYHDRLGQKLDSRQNDSNKFSGKPPTTGVKLSEITANPSLAAYPSGAISLNSPYYIERTEIETKILSELSQPGALVRLKAPQEMGKTSIVLRVLDSLKQQDFLSVYINFEQADSKILNHLDRLLRWMLANITFQLQLDSNLDRYWSEEMGAKLSSTLYLQTILDAIDRPVILVLNQVNQIFEYSDVAKDFLPLIRSWYEESKRIQVWQKLRMVMVHSTDVYVQLHYNQSPFNVGLPIQITPFDRNNIQQLASRYGMELSPADLQQLEDNLGGKPALVHIAIYHLSRNDRSLSDILSNAASSEGIYRHHLQRQWTTLNEQSDLLEAVRSLLAPETPTNIEPHIVHRLTSMGLIATKGDRVGFSCGLYGVYFRSQLL